MAISEQLIEDVVFNLMKFASIELPKDVVDSLKKAHEREDSLVAKGQLEAILKSVQISHDKQIGLCQDTGVPIIYADLGTNCKIDGDPNAAMTRAVVRATKEVPLRQNVINPLTKANSGTNTGWGIPYFHWDMEGDKDYVEIMAVPKGFGSEMRGSQCWILSSEDVSRGAVKAVLDVVEDSMGEPCPPVIIGVGIGGFSDSSMAIAKKALFRTPIGTRNADPIVAALEEEIETAVNNMELGPMGFGGKTYTLGVHIEISGSHTAVIPVSVIFQCWACRYSKARIYNDGRVEYLTHPEGGK
ncbi:fumarate hydratase [Selenomonadales bacterium OttesenSCG-928-I06]|nr:fumarate hydratase [Selenomonadales bacterium OttesenSCG-928-I06]